jgi:hypothetical protein
MIQDLLDLALGANRVLCYAGYVLLAGTLTFWCVVWPDGRRNRRLVMLALAGTTAMTMGTIAGPAIQLIFEGQLLGNIVTPLAGAAQLARLAALIAAMFFLPDIIGGARGGLASHPRPHPGVGDRRVDGGAVQCHRRSLGDCQDRCYRPACAGNVRLARWTPRPRHSFDPWREGAGAGSAHPALLASGTAECRDSDRDRHRARSAVAGGVYQLAGSRYGLVLLIKASIFGLMLLMGNEGRKYAARAAFRLQHQPPEAPLRAGGISTPAVVMGAEFCIAFVILSTTSHLVMVAPLPLPWRPQRGAGLIALPHQRDVIAKTFSRYRRGLGGSACGGRSYSRHMRGFRRRRQTPLAVEQLGGTGQTGRAGPPSDPRAAMRRVAAEAVILQDEAEAVIRGVRAREGLGFLAPRGGPLVRRFFSLRDLLPRACDDPADEQRRRQLDAILHHHALAVSVALDLLAYEWRSERIACQLDALDGLGTPAVQLEQLYAELAGRSTDHVTEAVRASSAG